MSNSIMPYDETSDGVMGGLDQILPMAEAQARMLEKADKIIENSVAEGNPDLAANEIDYLSGMTRVSGISKSKMIYLFKHQWDNFHRTDTFDEYCLDRGWDKVQVKRHYRVWAMIVSGDVPREYMESLKLLPIKSLIAIGSIYAQGFIPTDEEWSALAHAPNVTTINKLTRKIRKSEPRKGSLQLELDTDGSIYAWENGVREFIGSLNVSSESPIVQKAIARIMGDKILEK